MASAWARLFSSLLKSSSASFLNGFCARDTTFSRTFAILHSSRHCVLTPLCVNVLSIVLYRKKQEECLFRSTTSALASFNPSAHGQRAQAQRYQRREAQHEHIPPQQVRRAVEYGLL